ncbi:MAG: DNA-binding protein [Planctomycetes bacterium]|nr:DNA-binding protein [Planctomycetota bacterium]
MENRTVAEWLTNFADYLDATDANPYRARAYRRAAETMLQLDRPVSHIVDSDGRKGLEELPGIGSHLSYTIDTLVRTGEFRTMNSEGGHVDCERLFASLPGIGPQLARKIREELGLQTLEELEQAAHEGRLAGLKVGPKRLRGIMDALAGRLRRRRMPEPVRGEPPVADLLTVDQEYRDLAEKGGLPTLAPRRFNPQHQPWLPLLQGKRGGWYYRAEYSNSALAHRLGQTRDWVVISFDDGVVSGQRTVVTETRGSLRGQRVVRGREVECQVHYQLSVISNQ